MNEFPHHQISPHSFCKHEIRYVEERPLHILVVAGSWYEMGLHIGRALGKEISTELGLILPRLTIKIAISINRRREIKEDIEAGFKNFIPYVPKALLEHNKGIYQGCIESGYPIEDYRALEKMIILTELGERLCNMYAVNRSASGDGNTYQLRDLDYFINFNSTYQPCVITYLPQDEQGNYYGNAFASVGFTNTIGTGPLTGINEKGVVVSQIRGTFETAYRYKGVPLASLLHTIYCTANNASEAAIILNNSNRS